MSNAKTICTVCNYVYDETTGEPRQNITPSVKFADLPEQWVCPECNANKEMFQPCSCVSLSAQEQTCIPHGLKSNRNSGAVLSKDASVGELVATNPRCACVLEQYGIDYCCGGKISLAEVCKKKGLNVEEVLQKLAQAAQQPAPESEPDWTRTTLKELTRHIVVTYHDPLRLALSRILPLAEKVARVHADNHPEMVKVLEIFLRLKEQLEVHMQKEELILFPSIDALEAKQGPVLACGGRLEHPIAVMTMEHDEAGEALCAIRRLTNDFAVPPDACTTFKLLLSSLASFEAEMHTHVHKENNILFPRALEMYASADGELERRVSFANQQ